MYLRAGLISMALLLLSRVLGLARESVQAAAFGSSALADVVVTLMTLPDMASNILAGGALSYALLPWWARQSPADMAASQRRAAQIFMVVGALLALWLALQPSLWAHWLAEGVGVGMQGPLHAALRWSALAMPLSLLSFVWYTRLQHERDVVGMYGMNLAHTVVVIAALASVGLFHPHSAMQVVALLGVGLLLAFASRNTFLWWRLQRVSVAADQAVPAVDSVPGLPPAKVWLWALAATGLPIAVPLMARSLVSQSAPGALADFNYAWKLIEVPLSLAVQLVSVLAFAPLARAHAQGQDLTDKLRTVFVVSWVLACVGAVGLAVAAWPLAHMLFGWGRMGPDQVQIIARWAATGAWTLLPQSLITATLLLLATLHRLRVGALVYVSFLVVLGLSKVHDGQAMMYLLCTCMAVAVIALLVATGAVAWRALAWFELAVPMLVAIALSYVAPMLVPQSSWWRLPLGALAALLVVASSLLTGSTLRKALQR